MFKRFSQRERFDFEQMRKNFNIDFIEAFERIKQSFFKRRDRLFKRKRRERRKDNRDKARNDARDDVKDNVEDNATDKTNVFMKNSF